MSETPNQFHKNPIRLKPKELNTNHILSNEKPIPLIKYIPNSPNSKEDETTQVQKIPIQDYVHKIATLSDLIRSNHINYFKTWYDEEKHLYSVSTMINGTSFVFLESAEILPDAFTKLANKIYQTGFEL